MRIIPHIETKDSTHKFVVIANYRIPLEKYVLEFPAGGPDGTETDLQCALRELKVSHELVYIFTIGGDWIYW